MVKGTDKPIREKVLFCEGNVNPLQYSCLENPTDGGAWWATVHWVAKSRTRLSNFTFTFTSNYGGGNESNGDLLQKIPCMYCYTQCPQPTLQQATTDPLLHWRLLDTPRKVWFSLLWGHCSFLLGPGAHKILFVPSRSLFPSPV